MEAARYYDKYIDLVYDQGNDRSKTKWRRYKCLLGGEVVGQVEWQSERERRWEKDWEAEILDDDARMKHLGWYDTMYAAKAAIFKAVGVSTRKKKTPVEYLPSADFEFYPTPSDVAGKLLSGVDWTNVKTILEPSAGKGDLLTYAKHVKTGFKDHWGYQTRIGDKALDIDCIEIDENLRYLLKGKGYRIVHDDFLTFRTRKQYDLILMNPPFSTGEYHLLHAIELVQNGGQIACILNAETLRNPYSKSRLTLLKELKRVGAEIRYLIDGFKHAERRADVDVALINIKVPFSLVDSSLYDNLKKAEDNRGNVIDAKAEIAPANNVERLIREYDLLCQTGIELIKTYNGVRPYIMRGSDRYSKPMIELSICGHTAVDACGTEEVNQFLQGARWHYWRMLFDLPEIRNRMTSQMKDEYSSTVDEMRDYEFSEFNILQVIDRIQKQLGQGVEEAIMKCFDKLSNEHAYHEDIENDNIHYYNGWKTNKAHYVNSKCIIPTWGCFARSYKPDKYGRYKDVYTDIDPRECFAVLDDLEKALDYLDKGETYPTSLSRQLENAASCGRTTVACKYFDVTFYKKGTAHIKFRDQKILDRLNIFAAKNRSWLPPSYGKVRYNDMDDESKRVVDEFMGREHYEKVMDQPDQYVIEGITVPLLN